MIRENDLLKIIKYATKAPSGHNTQPWKFMPGKSSVTILPDFERALPVADTDHHELYISIGCALENLKIAAGAFGYTTAVKLQNTRENTSVEVHFEEGAGSVNDELFNCIEKRQVRRNFYSARPVTEDTIEALQDLCREDGIGVHFFTTPGEREFLSPFLLEAVSLQTGNKDFMKELTRWSRFSEKEALKSGDGIWSATLNLPNTGRLLGSFLFNHVITVNSEIKRWEKLISHTPCFVLFTVDKHEPAAWIKLGEVFQRFALSVTNLGLSHAHANMPCEEVSVRNKMIQQLYLGDKTPLLLIRLGYAQPMPYSFRRHLNEVITG